MEKSVFCDWKLNANVCWCRISTALWGLAKRVSRVAVTTTTTSREEACLTWGSGGKSATASQLPRATQSCSSPWLRPIRGRSQPTGMWFPFFTTTGRNCENLAFNLVTAYLALRQLKLKGKMRMFLVSDAGRSKPFYITLLRKAEQGELYRACWHPSTDEIALFILPGSV